MGVIGPQKNTHNEYRVEWQENGKTIVEWFSDYGEARSFCLKKNVTVMTTVACENGIPGMKYGEKPTTKTFTAESEES